MRGTLLLGIIACSLLWSSVTCQDDLCYDKVDILFIMDASGSVGASDFTKQLQFASTFVNNFPVGIAQFSAMTFDTTPTIVFDFKDHQDSTSLKNAIVRIPFTGGGTNTGTALKLARQQAFLASRGSRPGVPKIAIVSTDGQSNDPDETKIEAKLLRDSNVLVLTIGVGSSYNKHELDAIASYPEDTFLVIDYDQLLSIVHDYSELVCNEVKLFECNHDLDAYFLLDSSARMSYTSLQSAGSYAANISSKFRLTTNNFGAATFGGSVQKLFGLGDYKEPWRISNVLTNISPVYGLTDIAGALQYILSQRVFDPAFGGRVNATKVLIIFTDGGSPISSQARDAATQLRLTGVNILAVGVSSPNITELQQLVQHPVLDVVTNLANPTFATGRIQSLTAYTECKVPSHGVNNVSEFCKIYNWENGIHPHPYDCRLFIECTYLKTDIMHCPPNLAYDPIIQTCNHMSQVAACFDTPKTTPPVVTAPPSTSKPCVKGNLDILLIFDSSIDASSSQFSDELHFAANLAENFLLGPNAVQFACISFGQSPRPLFNFNAFTEYKPLQTAILNAAYQGGIPNTHLALQIGLTFFDLTHGARPGTPKVVIIFTNGRSSDPKATEQQASLLKKAGVYVITVGFWNPTYPELEAIASNPNSAFHQDFDGVLAALLKYSNTTCDQDFVCKGIQLADVVFVLDSSNSITQTDYKSQLEFVADVTENFLLGPDDVHFGAIVFSQDVKKLFDLRDFNSHDTLRAALLSAPHLKSGTDTAKALRFVYDDDMFGIKAGGRYNATKILIILTDGRSNSIDDTVKAANRLKATEVKFISIGIGGEIYIEELRQLASDNQSLFHVPGYDALHEIQESVTRKTCELPKEPEGDYSKLCSLFNWADGKHPNPYDCSTYVICHSFVTTIVHCPLSLVYDPVVQVCRDKSVAHRCNDTLHFGPTVPPPTAEASTTRRPPPIVITNVCSDYRLVDGIYPDPGSCKHFVECTSQRTDHFACPDNLHYNSVLQVCDDVHVVNCDINYNYFNNLG